MSGYGYLHQIHRDDTYWVVSWGWGKSRSWKKADYSQTREFSSEKEALKFAESQQDRIIGWKELPVVYIKVSKIDPVMSWEKGEVAP